MKNEEPDAPGRPHDWAARLLSRLESRDDIDRTLHVVVHGQQDLSGEVNLRRAQAVHAAAMGLGSAGCAAAAGISEAMLASWRSQDSAFDAAIASATAMAATHQVAPPGKLNGTGLGLLLQSLVHGTFIGTAASAVNLRLDQLRRLRMGNPAIDDLITEALARGHARRKPKRGKRTYNYRLVSTDVSAIRSSSEADKHLP
ncbi:MULTISPECIES: hypothetical protein [unclassified Streptomyces]|uniref:hypothetical protein n=1 Tax=unclassified Streptomyces TaxID=2593676 RepID=UPI0022536A60|nr:MULTISPECIES: hypothetical protein [unclassified Streptomyces]MCX4631268.1 hypothetical protein [Streptomyces sp. NBC_01443]